VRTNRRFTIMRPAFFGAGGRRCDVRTDGG
jgi:hypothetical protein